MRRRCAAKARAACPVSSTPSLALPVRRVVAKRLKMVRRRCAAKTCAAAHIFSPFLQGLSSHRTSQSTPQRVSLAFFPSHYAGLWPELRVRGVQPKSVLLLTPPLPLRRVVAKAQDGAEDLCSQDACSLPSGIDAPALPLCTRLWPKAQDDADEVCSQDACFLPSGIDAYAPSPPVRRVVAKAQDGAEEVWDADALVFAVGVSAMQRIVATSPGLASKQQFTGRRKLSG